MSIITYGKHFNMVYLKTLFYSPIEIKYLKLSLAEAFNYIDKFIICEFNYNHVGEKRDLIFEKYLDQFTNKEKEKIIYIGADISQEIKPAKNNSQLAHKNEQIMRGYFVKKIDLNDNDIVFSVDADEVLFNYVYPEVIRKLRSRRYFWQPQSYLFQLYQFFYKVNYLWENNKFIAPVACLAKFYKNRYPGQWRYQGKLYPGYSGCHFSWCLTILEMIDKINAYAHQSNFAHLAKTEILEAAIRDKKYPFDDKVDFKIKVLNINLDKKYYPVSIYSQLNSFKDLIV